MQRDKNRHAREKRKTAGVRGVSPVGVKVEELWRKGFVEKMSFEPGIRVGARVSGPYHGVKGP